MEAGEADDGGGRRLMVKGGGRLAAEARGWSAVEADGEGGKASDRG